MEPRKCIFRTNVTRYINMLAAHHSAIASAHPTCTKLLSPANRLLLQGLLEFTMSMSSSSYSSSKKTISSKTSYSGKTTTTTSMKSSSSSHISGKKPTMSSLCFSDMMGERLGLDMGKEMEKMMLEMGMDTSSGSKSLMSSSDSLGMSKARRELLHLMPLTTMDAADELVKLDAKSIDQYFEDAAKKDRLKFNLDVDEFESESINVKAVGNKIEVHAQKKSRKGDDHKSEEYSRTYQLPTSEPVDPEKLTSSFYKDGVLTIELPVDATKMLTI